MVALSSVFACHDGLHVVCADARGPRRHFHASAGGCPAERLHLHVQSEALAAAMQEKGARGGKGIFKRKKAKGPNPLAMKKGKKAAQQQQSGGSQQKPHRKRARRRSAAAAGGADQAA